MALSIENIEADCNQIAGKLSRKDAGFYANKKKRHVHLILVISIWAMFIIASIVMIIRAVHFIIPDCWCWLDPVKLQNIDKFLFSGAFGGILAKYAKYIFTDTHSE